MSKGSAGYRHIINSLVHYDSVCRKAYWSQMVTMVPAIGKDLFFEL